MEPAKLGSDASCFQLTNKKRNQLNKQMFNHLEELEADVEVLSNPSRSRCVLVGVQKHLSTHQSVELWGRQVDLSTHRCFLGPLPCINPHISASIHHVSSIIRYPRPNRSAHITDVTDIADISRVQDHGRLTAVHISKHSPSHHVETLKITVGCPSCTNPSIHVETLKITVGCRLCTYPSILLSPDEDTLNKITVGCLTSTYPSIHILTTLKISRSRSVARRAHIQAFVQKLADMLDSMVHAGCQYHGGDGCWSGDGEGQKRHVPFDSIRKGKTM